MFQKDSLITFKQEEKMVPKEYTEPRLQKRADRLNIRNSSKVKKKQSP